MQVDINEALDMTIDFYDNDFLILGYRVVDLDATLVGMRGSFSSSSQPICPLETVTGLIAEAHPRSSLGTFYASPTETTLRPKIDLILRIQYLCPGQKTVGFIGKKF